MVSQWDDFIFVGTSKEMSLAGAATKYNCPLWNDFAGIENHLWLHLSKYTYCENCSQRREHYWYYGSSFSHAVTKIIADDKNFSLLLRRRYIDFANPCTLMLIVNNTICTVTIALIYNSPISVDTLNCVSLICLYEKNLSVKAQLKSASQAWAFTMKWIRQ